MTHELETFTDGTAAFASARLDAWHRLGTVVEHAMTAEEAMNLAYLSKWNVRKLPLTATEGAENLVVPDAFATVRTHPKTGRLDVLGVVGSDYTPVQNEEACELLNAIIDESGAHFETAGSLKEGRQVFVTMKLPDHIKLAGVDDLDLYLAATTSHDGSARFRITATPVRIVCANTQRAALQASRAEYSIKHTRNAHGRVGQAREALGVTFEYFGEFQKAAERMMNETLTAGGFENVANQLWPKPKEISGRAVTNHSRRMGRLRYLFNGARTNKVITGTRWGGYQAITEYLDHYAPAKNPEVRASRVLTSPAVAELKEKAHKLLTV